MKILTKFFFNLKFYLHKMKMHIYNEYDMIYYTLDKSYILTKFALFVMGPFFCQKVRLGLVGTFRPGQVGTQKSHWKFYNYFIRAWISMRLRMIILEINQNLKILVSNRKRNAVHSYDVINFCFYNLLLNRFALSHDHDFSTPGILEL